MSIRVRPPAGGRNTQLGAGDSPPAITARELSFWYGKAQVLAGVSIEIPARRITSIIGPSGCGKSTFLRCFNRMNDLIPGARMQGGVLFDGTDLYAPDVDVVDIRRRIGMVFQKPNPFPKSIFDNVAYGPRVNGYRGSLDDVVEKSLRRAALWDDVKHKLGQSGLALSGGQQQRLCIARALAIEPEILLMDEPCSSLDPIATTRIEDLMQDLRSDYTIIIVTHNMQQAARVSDNTAFFMLNEHGAGVLVEFGDTGEIFTLPKDPRTEAYITGRFG